tara:strand:- start:2096 stop:2347 length:252 start_codon:yes stop_codon:yes gene_type:complete
MENLAPIILQNLSGQGLPLLLVLAALLYFYKGNTSLLTSFNEERNARLDAMDSHIQALEAKSRECEADRVRLWERLVEHTNKA